MKNQSKLSVFPVIGVVLGEAVPSVRSPVNRADPVYPPLGSDNHTAASRNSTSYRFFPHLYPGQLLGNLDIDPSKKTTVVSKRSQKNGSVIDHSPETNVVFIRYLHVDDRFPNMVATSAEERIEAITYPGSPCATQFFLKLGTSVEKKVNRDIYTTADRFSTTTTKHQLSH
ncbi:MAG: hypothetical protein GY703_24515 [Gammaproteobacteria bacterium]|nr:hypothetical protein [Gammaproteobacteria bacterium]